MDVQGNKTQQKQGKAVDHGMANYPVLRDVVMEFLNVSCTLSGEFPLRNVPA